MDVGFHHDLLELASELFRPNGVQTIRVVGDPRYQAMLLERGYRLPDVGTPADGVLCVNLFASADELAALCGKVLICCCLGDQQAQLNDRGFEHYEDLTTLFRAHLLTAPVVNASVTVLAAPNPLAQLGEPPYCLLTGLEQQPVAPNNQRIMVGMPSYDGCPQFQSVHAMYRASRTRSFATDLENTSFLAAQFNKLWAKAVARNFGWFVMLHDDVCPMIDYFADVLLYEQQRTGADVVSTVIPIKNHDGTTSTSVEFTHDGQRVLKRLTMHECVSLLPITFGIDDVVAAGLVPRDSEPILLPNTGCWIAKLDDRWCRHPLIDFNLLSWIEYGDQYPEGYRVCSEPEDWRFGRALRALGRKLVVTRKVPLSHVGKVPFGNQNDWGHVPHDNPIPGFHWERDNPQARAVFTQPPVVIEPETIDHHWPLAGELVHA